MIAPWLEVALRELVHGVMEESGSRHNQRILEYHRATSLGATDDETPWCAAFANWCLRQAWIPGTGSALARSFRSWGKPLDAPRPGAVIVLWRGSPTGAQGHVAFLLDFAPGVFYLLGGNQGDRVSVAAYPMDRLLPDGIRWPD